MALWYMAQRNHAFFLTMFFFQTSLHFILWVIHMATFLGFCKLVSFCSLTTYHIFQLSIPPTTTHFHWSRSRSKVSILPKKPWNRVLLKLLLTMTMQTLYHFPFDINKLSLLIFLIGMRVLEFTFSLKIYNNQRIYGICLYHHIKVVFSKVWTISLGSSLGFSLYITTHSLVVVWHVGVQNLDFHMSCNFWNNISQMDLKTIFKSNWEWDEMKKYMGCNWFCPQLKRFTFNKFHLVCLCITSVIFEEVMSFCELQFLANAIGKRFLWIHVLWVLCVSNKGLTRFF